MKNQGEGKDLPKLEVGDWIELTACPIEELTKLEPGDRGVVSKVKKQKPSRVSRQKVTFYRVRFQEGKGEHYISAWHGDEWELTNAPTEEVKTDEDSTTD